jgi:hypothetical protein
MVIRLKAILDHEEIRRAIVQHLTSEGFRPVDDDMFFVIDGDDEGEEVYLDRLQIRVEVSRERPKSGPVEDPR